MREIKVRRHTGTWVTRVLGIFLATILLLVLMVLTLRAAGAGQFGLIADLNSKLKANYGIDLFADSLGSLDLSLISDVFKGGGRK